MGVSRQLDIRGVYMESIEVEAGELVLPWLARILFQGESKSQTLLVMEGVFNLEFQGVAQVFCCSV